MFLYTVFISFFFDFRGPFVYTESVACHFQKRRVRWPVRQNVLL